jgi:predicted RNA-binding protein (virulence factor B family)
MSDHRRTAVDDTARTVEVGEFATLRVKAVDDNGAYLNWGPRRDLFLPRREEKGDLRPGDLIVVFITLDRSERPIASMLLEDFLEHDPSKLSPDQRVDLLIIGETDIGFKAIIDQEHLGVLYHSEIFQPIAYGQRLTGFVKKVREDGKVDLILQPSGTKGTSDLGARILAEVEKRGGFLALPEKGAPEAIYDLFGVSKKKYKIALGDLYKNRKITLHDDGVRRT